MTIMRILKIGALALLFVCVLIVGYFFQHPQITEPKRHEIPVRFLPLSKAPLIEVEIEGKKYSLELDLGSNGEIILKDRVISSLREKTPDKIRRSLDINGNVHLSPSFMIPRINLDKMHFSNKIAKKENDQFLTQGSQIWVGDGKDIDEKMQLSDGRIGLNFFKHYNLLLDFPRSSMVVTEGSFPFTKEDWKCVPFELNETGTGVIIPLQILVDNKSYSIKFLLDSGAQISLIRKSLVKNKNTKLPPGTREKMTIRLSAEDIDLGQQVIYLHEFTDALNDFQAILGIDFLMKHSVFLDFQHNVAYIGLE